MDKDEIKKDHAKGYIIGRAGMVAASSVTKSVDFFGNRFRR